jgi:thiamine monophosphate kinase
LLLSISPSDYPAIQRAYQEASIPIQVIGQVREGVARVLARDGKQVKELEPFTRDEILKIF